MKESSYIDRAHYGTEIPVSRASPGCCASMYNASFQAQPIALAFQIEATFETGHPTQIASINQLLYDVHMDPKVELSSCAPFE